MIEKRGSKFVVVSHEGKSLGEYDTKGEAEKRLKQVEYFKHAEARSAGHAKRIYPSHK